MNRLINVVSVIPSDQEIEETERKLAEMKKAREESKKKVLVDVRQSLDLIPSFLDVKDSIRLLVMLNHKLKSDHKPVRGSPVKPDLKKNLEIAIRENGFTIQQLAELFGLSVSYVARTKKELGLTHGKSRKRVDEVHQEPAVAA